MRSRADVDAFLVRADVRVVEQPEDGARRSSLGQVVAGCEPVFLGEGEGGGEMREELLAECVAGELEVCEGLGVGL